MFSINASQIKELEQYSLDKFILSLISNLRDKQGDVVDSYSESALIDQIKFLINWLTNYNVIDKQDVEYMVNIFFSYQLTKSTLVTNSVIEIFTYPNRKGFDKIRELHFSLEHPNTQL